MKTLFPLILGLVIFLGGHIVTRFSSLRAGLIARLGENVFKGLYSLVAIMGIAMIAHGFSVYRAAGYIPLWEPPKAMKHIAVLLVWLAMILLAASVFAKGRISARAKHPMLLSVKIWALAHLLANGDAGSVLLFGSLLGWAVFTRIKLKRAGNFGDPSTANGPNAARNDMIAVAIGTVLTLAFVFGLHKWLFGVAIF